MPAYSCRVPILVWVLTIVVVVIESFHVTSHPAL